MGDERLSNSLWIIKFQRFLLEKNVSIRMSVTVGKFVTRILSNPGNSEVEQEIKAKTYETEIVQKTTALRNWFHYFFVVTSNALATENF